MTNTAATQHITFEMIDSWPNPPGTRSASQTNRLIAELREHLLDKTLDKTQHPKVQQWIRELELRSLNQIRIAQGKPPRETVPLKKKVRSLTVTPQPPQLEEARLATQPYFKDLGLPVSQAPVNHLTLEELIQRLQILPDRSSQEASRLRKRIRLMKDMLGIERSHPNHH